jgi:hypothetical protein
MTLLTVEVDCQMTVGLLTPEISGLNTERYQSYVSFMKSQLL